MGRQTANILRLLKIPEAPQTPTTCAYSCRARKLLHAAEHRALTAVRIAAAANGVDSDARSGERLEIPPSEMRMLIFTFCQAQRCAETNASVGIAGGILFGARRTGIYPRMHKAADLERATFFFFFSSSKKLKTEVKNVSVIFEAAKPYAAPSFSIRLLAPRKAFYLQPFLF